MQYNIRIIKVSPTAELVVFSNYRGMDNHHRAFASWCRDLSAHSGDEFLFQRGIVLIDHISDTPTTT